MNTKLQINTLFTGITANELLTLFSLTENNAYQENWKYNLFDWVQFNTTPQCFRMKFFEWSSNKLTVYQDLEELHHLAFCLQNTDSMDSITSFKTKQFIETKWLEVRNGR